ncbi:MAG: hypothetical protein Solumvirus1_27 [Solumvirus sp.]|uniref:Uncharacterized protein n=1 Tax=Solumvirus sp. TaxID=2487773 RepID=A0A3G5AG58_9VIRU|nr:MAG: hypothetical protein Solumvirus1_27 [Solumvirus sp.]
MANQGNFVLLPTTPNLYAGPSSLLRDVAAVNNTFSGGQSVAPVDQVQPSSLLQPIQSPASFSVPQLQPLSSGISISQSPNIDTKLFNDTKNTLLLNLESIRGDLKEIEGIYDRLVNPEQVATALQAVDQLRQSTFTIKIVLEGFLRERVRENEDFLTKLK